MNHTNDSRGWNGLSQPDTGAALGRLLVVGGGNLERFPDGTWRTKASIAEYLNQLAAHFGRCVWMAPLVSIPMGLTGRLDEKVVKIVPFDSSPLGTLKSLVTFSVLCGHRPLALLFLPAVVPLLPSMPLARLMCRRMVVYLGNDYAGQLGQEQCRRGIWRTIAFRIGHEYPMKLADTILARGRHLARVARTFNESVIETVPISSAFAAPYPEKDEKQLGPARILFVGKLAFSKGVGDLLIAFREVHRRHPDVVLDLVGDGLDRPALQLEAERLSVSGATQFHGWIESREELANFFGHAEVLVVPSSQAEGVPRVIEEALGSGLPVIATRVGGIPHEFSEEEVLLVPPGNPDHLGKAIESVLFDPVTRARFFSGRNRRFAANRGPESAADQHFRVIVGRQLRGITADRSIARGERSGRD